jgi:hypothetical protein
MVADVVGIQEVRIGSNSWSINFGGLCREEPMPPKLKL